MTEIKLNVAGVGNDGGMLVRLDDVKSVFQSQQERIAELERVLFKQSQESKEAVLRAIEIILEKDAKIAELENKVKHLNQVVYNTAKVAFEAGACCPDVDFHQSAILFAKELLKEQGE